MSTLSSANVTDVNLVLKERTHMRLCINMLIFTHNLGNWLITANTDKKLSTSVTTYLLTYLITRIYISCIEPLLMQRVCIWHSYI